MLQCCLELYLKDLHIFLFAVHNGCHQAMCPWLVLQNLPLCLGGAWTIAPEITVSVSVEAVRLPHSSLDYFVPGVVELFSLL